MDLNQLTLGRNEVSGDEIFINRMRYETIEPSEGFYEAHLEYVEIQVVLEGKEQVFVSNIQHMEAVKKDVAADFVEYRGEKEAVCKLCPQKVLIVMPEDAHMVKLKDDTKEQVEKLVVKVKL